MQPASVGYEAGDEEDLKEGCCMSECGYCTHGTMTGSTRIAVPGMQSYRMWARNKVSAKHRVMGTENLA
jgi:hypothetical protein